MRIVECEHYVVRVEIPAGRAEPGHFPFTLPAIAGLESLELHPKVTFVVGENGSGKSTLVEAIAVAAGLNPEGGSRNFTFSTRASHSALHKALRLVRGPRRPRDSFFLRAESYFNLATSIEELDQEPGPGARIMPSYSNRSLHEQSHGESFMALIENRLRGNGFYVLDEPEAALSPTRQLAMLARMKKLVDARSQFVIATHSPILMAYPDAWIYRIGPDGLERVRWNETEHVRVMRRFLADPERMLGEVFGTEDPQSSD